jgi:AraC-like DNA-binding protein
MAAPLQPCSFEQMKDAPNSKRPNADVIGRNPTVIGSYMLLLARALDARGIPSREVFEQAGVSMASWHDPLQRVPVAAVRRVYEIVFDLTGDPCFGLEVSRHFQMPMLHALGHSLVASRTLREFCTRLSRSLRLVSQGAQMKLIEAGDTAQLLVTDIATVVPAESEDVLCGFLVRSMREITGDRFRPQRIELRRSAPNGSARQHEGFYGCRVEFEKPNISIVFEQAVLDVELPLGSDELAHLNDRVVRTYLERLDRADFVNHVRSLVIEALPSGRATKSAVARRFGVSARTLQARLGDRGTSFVELMDATRQALACAYLDDASISIGEIAYLVGFSDTSNFTRAFKRWTGVSPSSHRAKSAHAANRETESIR